MNTSLLATCTDSHHQFGASRLTWLKQAPSQQRLFPKRLSHWVFNLDPLLLKCLWTLHRMSKQTFRDFFTSFRSGFEVLGLHAGKKLQQPNDHRDSERNVISFYFTLKVKYLLPIPSQSEKYFFVVFFHCQFRKKGNNNSISIC